MRLDLEPETIIADDETIRAAVAEADVAALLPAIAEITGDLSLLREDFRPDANQLLDPNAGLTDAQIAAAREAAAAALIAFRDAGCPPQPALSADDFKTMIEFLVGSATEQYLPLLREELSVAGEDLRAPSWHKGEVAPDRPFRVGIVGAGMSGILAAHRLQQAGVDFTIYEKNADVGGTWFENTYPGCRVDVPNHLYSYSFAQTGDWPQFFSSQDVLLDYFRSCAEHFGVRPHVRFEHEVTGAAWDENAQQWVLTVRSADGTEVEDRVEALVSAVGQLNRPQFPDIPGRDRFAGEWFHSARWDDSVDLKDRRVLVIGTGASAAQFIPVVAEQAAELTVFQRTPPWLVPTPNNHDELPDGVRWVLRHVPAYARWDRLWLFWRTHEGLLPMAEVDPEWDNGGKSISAPNELVRQLLEAYLRMEFPEDDLFEKVLPTYPPIAKRIVRDNGIWARTLRRDNVELVTEAIEEITEKGVRTADGVEHQGDVLIYGTGFQASKFLTPMQIVGRDGVDLHQQWDGDARAYLGIVVPHFPNLFLLYGPNTNIVINGSIIYFSECEVHYLVEAIHALLADDKASMDCREEVHDAYNERIDEANKKMAWGASTVNSWYKNAKGRVAQNWPFALLEYWQQTREVDRSDYTWR
ncbi:MAG: flavin-containing monooxygenase [Acidimicrobiia bacterium]